MTVSEIQAILDVTIDGDFGPVTTGAAEEALGVVRLPDLILPDRIRRIQRILGAQVTADGILGPVTLAALGQRLRPHTAEPGEFATLIAATAEAEIGVSEEGGNNIGERVNTYKAATWLDPEKPWAWCAAFVCYCVKQALLKQHIQAFTRPRTAGAWDLETGWASGKYGQVPGARIIRKPSLARRGDIVVYTFSHCGIVTAPFSDGYITAVEGNTNRAGSREGDGVFKKYRSSSKIRSLIRITQ